MKLLTIGDDSGFMGVANFDQYQSITITLIKFLGGRIKVIETNKI